MFFLTITILSILISGCLMYFYGKKYVWWELLLQLVVPILIGLAVWGIAKNSGIKDTEYWGSTCIKIRYEERYETYDEETYDCNCHDETDSKGNSHRECDTCTRMVCNWHGPYYKAYDKHGYEGLTQSQYEKILGKFGPHKKVGEQGSTSCDRGSIYEAEWPGTKDTYQVFVTSHTYENKVRYNDVYVNRRKLTKIEKESVLNYPTIYGIDQSAITGAWPNSADRDTANSILQYHTGWYGPKKREEHGQCKPMIFVFQDKPKDIAEAQRVFLEGGNKNEFILLLGVSGSKLQWYDVISFDESAASENRLKEYLHPRKGAYISLTEIARLMVKELSSNYIRKEFTPINQFITIKPSTGVWVFSIILILALHAFIAYKSIINEYEN